MSHLEDIAIRFQVYLEGLKTSEFRDFNKVLRLLEQAVSEEISDGEFSELTRAQMEKLVRRVSGRVGEDLEEAVLALIPNLKDLAAYSYEFEKGAILAGSTVKKLTARAKAEALWKEATERPMSATGDLLEPWIDRLTTVQINAVEALLRRAHSEGWTNKQILQVMKGTRANRYTDGLVAKLGRSNSTIIRTAMQHISSAAREKLWAENEDVVKGYRWVSTLDNRTSSTCRGLDGKVFKINEGPLPPIHPNCRSTTVAVLSEKYDVFDRGATRAAQGGPVPQNQTYYSWLKNQPADYQDSVIGPVRGILLRNGGLSTEEFTRLQLSSTFDPLTLDEMRRLKPLAFQRAGI